MKGIKEILKKKRKNCYNICQVMLKVMLAEFEFGRAVGVGHFIVSYTIMEHDYRNEQKV